VEQALTVSSTQCNPGHPSVSAGGGGSSSAAAHLPEETEAANALLEASLRAKVLDPSPNMPAILSWMQSLSSSAGASTSAAHYGPIAAAVRYEPLNGENDKQEKSTHSSNHSGHTSHGSDSSRNGSSSGIRHKTHHKSHHKMHTFRGRSDESMSSSEGSSSASGSQNLKAVKMSPKGMNDHIMTATRGDSEHCITSTSDSEGDEEGEDEERDVHVNKKMRTENHTEPAAAHITRW
jgi:hypothetical protein